MNFFNERKKDILIVALMIVIIGLVGCILVGISNKDTTKKNEVILEKKEDVIEANEEVLEEYYVDIKGAVKKTGVYKLNKGSIVNDVGQGDSSMIITPYRKEVILVDTGGVRNRNVSDDVISFMHSKGINSVDYMILSHGGMWLVSRIT